MELLLEPNSPGYPVEYLVARLGPRRRGLTDWQSLRASRMIPGRQDAEDLDTFGTIVHWCYRQMEGPLRRLFVPFFSLLEIRTLILCLRFLKVGEEAPVEILLRPSLLHPALRQIVQQGLPFEKTLTSLAVVLAATDAQFGTLPPVAAKGGKTLPLFEQHLLVATLQRMALTTLPLFLKVFVQYLIDCRNLLAINKFFHWREEVRPLLAAGGGIPPVKLDRVADAAALLRLAGSAGYCGKQESQSDRLESILWRFLAEKLQRYRRSDDPRVKILLFLWHSYLEQRNRSLLYHGRRLEPALLLEEILC